MNPDLQLAFTASLRDCLADYCGQVRRAGKHLSADNVHNLRIASRRLIAAVDAVHLLLRANRAVGIRKKIRKSLRMLGPLRDAQVQLKMAESQLETVEGMDTFIARLRKQERRLRRQAASDVRNIRPRSLEKPIKRFCRKIGKPLPDADPDHFLFTLNSIADSMFGAVLGRLRALDSRNPRTFHRLRIRFKKFRYLLEFLQTTLSVPDEQIEAIKGYQDTLGEIQDLTVLIERIEDSSEKHGTRKSAEVTDLLDKLNDRRNSRINSFLAGCHTVIDSWRSVPVRVRTDIPSIPSAPTSSAQPPTPSLANVE